MSIHPLAGKVAPYQYLINVPRLISAYYTRQPDPANPAHRDAFGTSGHRGSSIESSFNETHILSISQAIFELRKSQGITGPLYVGMDTHALSEPALYTAIEVFAANGLEQQFGKTWYARKDAPVSTAGKEILANLSPEQVEASELVGDKITAKLTQSPYNHSPIGGLKVVTDTGWFAARPSGTEDVYKIYAESFISEEHLGKIQAEAQAIVDAALKSSSSSS